MLWASYFVLFVSIGFISGSEGMAVVNKTINLVPFWAEFKQETLEVKFRQQAESQAHKSSVLLYLVSALLVFITIFPMLLNIADRDLRNIVLVIAAMPLVAACTYSALFLKQKKASSRCRVSILFVVLLNLSGAVLGGINAWYGFNISWTPVGAVIFSLGLAFLFPSFKRVLEVVVITVVINALFIVVVEQYLFVFSFDFSNWAGFLLCLTVAVPLARLRNIDRRQIFLIQSQLKTSESSLLNESFERRRLWQLLKQNVQTDPVTRLFEHHYFLKLCQLEIERARRYQRPLTLLVAQITDFVTLKAKYGDEWLNKAEMRVASMLRQQLRQQDIIGRINHNDFGMLLPEIGTNDAQIVIYRLQSVTLEQKAPNSDNNISIRLQIGLGGMPGKAEVSAQSENPFNIMLLSAMKNIQE